MHPDWRTLGSRTSAWFGAASHAQAAALTATATGADLDIRADGVRVHAGTGHDEISAAARELGLVPDPAGLQELRVRVDSPDPAALEPFWRSALGDDPYRRNPGLSIDRSNEKRPLRNRIHLDSGHPGPTDVAALEAAGGRALVTNPWYATVADADGNEVDVVPGGPLGEGEESTSDWSVLFGALAFYPGQGAELAATAARLADEAGLPLLVDVRPEGVVLDSGKDQWEHVPGFGALAAAVQREARSTSDNSRLRFVQFGIDAADIPAVQGFWAATLGYVPAPHPGITDLYDPRWLNPVVFFQPIDESETDRRAQRNRIRLELLVPADRLEARVTTAERAGGRVLDSTGDRYLVADPEGNELELHA